MIGYLLIGVAVMMFSMLGYVVVLGNFYLMTIVLTVYAFAGLAALTLFPALWEFWFPKAAKTLIAHKRASSFELVVDDVGWGEFIPSKTYMPEGLAKWKFDWTLLPRPIQKFFEPKPPFKKRPGRKPKNVEERARKEQEWMNYQRQQQLKEEMEEEMAEQIALKKLMIKGLGRPLWLQYAGQAANFNPYVLVPQEAKQDNPHLNFQLLQSWITGSRDIPDNVKEQLTEKLDELKTHVEKMRIVVDPRRFKEILPKMYTPSQIAAHGRIHEEIGRLGAGFPIGKILAIILIIVVALGGLAAVYFLFFNPQQQQVPSMLTMLTRTVHLTVQHF